GRLVAMHVSPPRRCMSVLFSNDPATTEIYPLSLHDALPIWSQRAPWKPACACGRRSSCACRRRCTAACCRTTSSSSPREPRATRSEEHTSELQSLRHLVCRLLLEKKKRATYSLHT